MRGNSNSVRTHDSSTIAENGSSPSPPPPPPERGYTGSRNSNHENENSSKQLVTGPPPGGSPRPSQSTDQIPIPPTPIRSPAPPPNATHLSSGQAFAIPLQRPRIRRKPATNEIVPADSHSLVALGMSPFMPGQDPMFNQNRLVRNEVILVQHFSRLERSYSASESNHAQKSQHIYSILTDHKASINNLVATPVRDTPICSDPDFTALFDAHVETRNALNALVSDFSSSAASTKASIDKLDDTIRRLASGPRPSAYADSSIAESTDVPVATQNTAPPNTSSKFSLPPILDYPVRGQKRKLQDLNPIPFLSSAASRSGSPVTAHPIYLPRSDYIIPNDSSRTVIYGPIKNTNDHLNSTTIANDAVHSVGLSPSMIHSVRPAPGTPDFLSVLFLKYEYACKFVDLVAFGLDGHPSRQAFFADEPSNPTGPALGVASSSKSKLR